MAVTRWQGTLFCSECESEAMIWWLQDPNMPIMPMKPEALPKGWTFAEGNATCRDHADLEPVEPEEETDGD